MKKTLSLILAAIMIAVTVVAVLPASAGGSAFSDVGADRWSYASVQYAVDKGYMVGTAKDRFSPENPLTRAMIATVLWRRQGSPKPKASSGFEDVADGAWYADAVAWAKENGVVNGVSKSRFAPDTNVTREQLATMLFRFSQSGPVFVTERADITTFNDFFEVSDWATDALGWAVEAGLVKGVSGNRLSPGGNATREQFAAIIERYDGKFVLEYKTPVLLSSYTEPEYPLVDDADFYVSTTGSDENDGSFAHPFATWERARDAVRTLDKTGRDGITVAFMAGEYGAIAVSLGKEDSGTAECPITYCAYGDGDVVFNDGFDVTADELVPLSDEDKALFSDRAADKIMKADVSGKLTNYDPITALILSDSGACILARFPNMYEDGTDQLFANAGEAIDKNHIVIDFLLLKKRIDKYHTTEGLLLYGYLTTGWYKDTLETADYDPATGSFLIPHPEKARMGGLRLLPEFDSREWNKTAVLNISEELDAAGEYWVDKETGTFYVYDPSGDYHFTGGGETMLSLNGTEYITLRGLDFKNSLGRMIKATDHPRGLTIEECTFAGCAADRMVEVTGDKDGVPLDVTVRGCEFSVSANVQVSVRGKSSADPFNTSTGVLIDNNYFTLANLRVGCEGAVCVELHAPVISHNYFKRCYWEAVDMRGSTNMIVEYNVFDEVGCNGDDTGAIQGFRSMASNGNVTRYNLCLNIVGGTNGRYCLYLDGTWGMEVYSNIFFNCDCCVMHNGIPKRNYVHDNILLTPEKSSSRLNAVHHEGVDILNYALEQDDLSIVTDDWAYTDWSSTLAFYDSHPDVKAQTAAMFPGLFDVTLDMDRMWDRDFIMHSSVKICGNAQINLTGSVDGYDEYNLTYSDITPDAGYTVAENPFFVNPSVGDYRIRAGAEFPDIQFEKIGRY